MSNTKNKRNRCFDCLHSKVPEKGGIFQAGGGNR